MHRRYYLTWWGRRGEGGDGVGGVGGAVWARSAWALISCLCCIIPSRYFRGCGKLPPSPAGGHHGEARGGSGPTHWGWRAGNLSTAHLVCSRLKTRDIIRGGLRVNALRRLKLPPRNSVVTYITVTPLLVICVFCRGVPGPRGAAREGH